MSVTTISTSPFEGQRPGTSGLRKKVSVRAWLSNLPMAH